MKHYSGKNITWKRMVFVILFVMVSNYCFADNLAETMGEGFIDRNVPVHNMLQKTAEEIDYNQMTLISQTLTDGEWKVTYKSVSTYDEQGKVTESFVQSPIGNEWINANNTFYTYDEQGNNIESLSYSWVNSEWSNYYKVSSSYDNQGNMTERLREIWVDGEWRNQLKYIDTYDEQGNLIGAQRQNWNVDTWDTSYQETNTFDDQGHMTERISGYPIDELYFKAIYTYDDKWQKIEMLWHSWIEESEEWNLTTKNTYTYDGLGNFEELIQGWNPEIEEWKTYRKTIYTYDAQGNMTEERQQSLVGSEWINGNVTANTYDEQGRMTEYMYQVYSDGELSHGYKSLYSYDYVTNIAENKSDMPEKILLTANYPNPFNLSTTIGFSLPESGYAELVIFNVMGQKVRELLSKHMPAGKHSIVWDGCDENSNPVTTGVYFSRLNILNSSVSGRMMLVK
ncbi:FlgD immunoglobulin-like domain containing protein [Candidatus Latescibacterota bacterium]